MKLTGKVVNSQGLDGVDYTIELPPEEASIIDKALRWYKDQYPPSDEDYVIINRLLGEDKPKKEPKKIGSKIEPFLDYGGYPEEDVSKETIIRKLNEIIAYINQE